MQRLFIPALLMALMAHMAFLAVPAVARPAGQPVANAAPPPGTKSMAHAYSYLVLGTAGPILLGYAMIAQGGTPNEIIGGSLISGGVFIGPSTGQFYAESYLSGLFGMGLRLGGAALTAYGIATAITGSGDGSAGAFTALVGMVTFLGGGLHGLIDTKHAVDRYREREERFGLAPTLTPAGGELRPGALAWMRF